MPITDAEFQLDSSGRPRHFLTIEGLSAAQLIHIMDMATSFTSTKQLSILSHRTIANLFFENSTRTRTAFELAGKRLGANVINMNAQKISTTKGETLLDTIHTLEAMNVDTFIIRSPHAGSAFLVAQHTQPNTAVINAGDGRHAHPTQAMLDMFTIRKHKRNFMDLSVCIVGDILHSRVARSQIQALTILGCKDIRLVAPETLLPTAIGNPSVQVFTNLREGIYGVDVVITLRLQKERMMGLLVASEAEYYARFGLTSEVLNNAKRDVIVMHPGPLNRGLEISSEVADSAHSVILEQVHYGIPTRMAVMTMVASDN